MRYKKIAEIGEDTGFLLGQQSADYFNFICGDCGRGVRRIKVDDVDAVGFWVTAKCKECKECKKEWKLKVSADWGEALSPHIKRRFNEIWQHKQGS